MEVNSLAKSLSAFAHPVRLGVLRELSRFADGLSAGDLARRLTVRQNTLSAHISALEQQGLVFGHRHGRYIIYKADAFALRDVVKNLQDLVLS